MATEMDHEAFANGLVNFVSHASAAISDIARGQNLGDSGTNNGLFNAFRASEHAGKAVLTLYGLTPRSIHDLASAAEQLRKARRGAHDQAERDLLADRIKALNGDADKLNTASYEIDPVEESAETERRLTLAVELAERCIDLYAQQATAPSRRPASPPDAHAQAIKRIAVAFQGPRPSVSTHPERDRLGADTNAAIDSACSTARLAAEAQATHNPSRLPGIKPRPEGRTQRTQHAERTGGDDGPQR